MSPPLQDTPDPAELALLAATAADDDRAAQLAQQFGLPLLTTGSDVSCCTQAMAVVVVSGEAIYLQQTGKGAPGPVAVEFGRASARHRSHSGTTELLGKAVGRGRKSPLRILDATAGLGRDAFVLADLGCEVVLCERDPVIAEMLRAGLHTATHSGDPWLSGVALRMQFYQGDARQLAATLLQYVDVIYLDPMFPQRTKSAAVKKEMALFQQLFKRAAKPQDADELLLWALRQDTARIVVKRAAGAPNLAELPPSHCIKGKAVRYDVYVQRKLR